MRWVGILFLGGLFFSLEVQAENLGKFELDELILKPRFEVTSEREGGFSLGSSWVGWKWQYDEKIGGTLSVGHYVISPDPSRFAPATDKSIQLRQATVRYQSFWGKVEMGLLPAKFGWALWRGESLLVFPLPLFYDYRLTPQHDLGTSYLVNSHGFSTSVAVINGEGGANKDNFSWYLGNWSYQPSERFQFHLSGLTGRTDSPAVADSEDITLKAGEAAEIRLGSLAFAFLGRNSSGVDFVAEAFVGDVIQSSGKSSFLSWHYDVAFHLTETWKLLARWDEWQLLNSSEKDQRRPMIGFSRWSRYGLSQMSFFWSSIQNEDSLEDRWLVTWKLTPQVQVDHPD